MPRACSAGARRSSRPHRTITGISSVALRAAGRRCSPAINERPVSIRCSQLARPAVQVHEMVDHLAHRAGVVHEALLEEPAQRRLHRRARDRIGQPQQRRPVDPAARDRVPPPRRAVAEAGGRDQHEPVHQRRAPRAPCVSAIAPPSEWPTNAARFDLELLEQRGEELRRSSRSGRPRSRAGGSPERPNGGMSIAITRRRRASGGHDPPPAVRGVAVAVQQDDRRQRPRSTAPARRRRTSRSRRCRAACPAQLRSARVEQTRMSHRPRHRALSGCCRQRSQSWLPSPISVPCMLRRRCGRLSAAANLIQRALSKLHVPLRRAPAGRSRGRVRLRTSRSCTAPNASTRRRGRSSCPRTTAVVSDSGLARRQIAHGGASLSRNLLNVVGK